MNFEKLKKMTEKQRKDYGKNLKIGKVYYESWIEKSFRNELGDWRESFFDKKGNEIFHINGNGYWHEITWDKYGDNQTSYGNGDGVIEINGRSVNKEEYEAFMKEKGDI